MAYWTHTVAPIGAFVEKDTGNVFEYSDLGDEYVPDNLQGFCYPHKVWVGDVVGQGWRFANVKKTVAYIVVDEDENGPITEKWNLKKNKEYAN